MGLIEPGFLADFVFYRLDSSGLMPLNVPVRQLVHGENVAGIDTVVVDGRVVVRGGKLTCIDEHKIIAELQAAHSELNDQIMSSEDSSLAVFDGIRRVYDKASRMPVPFDVTQAFLDPYAQNADQ